VTVGGDTTVKIWDFAKAECVQTFMEHQKPGRQVCMLKTILPQMANKYPVFFGKKMCFVK